jgi:septal ring factor EnvC (AmiA/AmiB activator)
METIARRRLVLHLVLAVFLPTPSLLPAAAVNQELEGIQKKIESEKKGLSQLQVKEGSVRRSLSKIEFELDKKNKQLKLANAKLATLVSEMASTKAEAERLDISVAERRRMLQRRATALYRWQRHGSPLMIFNGEGSLSYFLRRKHYLEMAIGFDRVLVAKLADDSKRQALVQTELTRKKKQLDEQQRAIGLAQQAVKQEAEKRKILLASLRREKDTRLRALKQMEAAAQRLQKMMETIARRSALRSRESPSLPSIGVGLDAMRGRLDWPVRGQVVAPFGKFKHPEFAAEVVRKGVDIEAPLGEGIQAVEKGRVVYADRFSGYGRMVVVDHGERYYTIYGHLSEIIKKTGDEVRRGEVLGRVGDSDSLEGPRLYFELRKDGRSVDPTPWFKKQ